MKLFWLRMEHVSPELLLDQLPGASRLAQSTKFPGETPGALVGCLNMFSLHEVAHRKGSLLSGSKCFRLLFMGDSGVAS